MMPIWPSIAARLIRATLVIDRAYSWFDRARSAILPRLASDKVLDAYNDLAYGHTPAYRADCSQFRHGLFRWEAEAIERFFPPAPARILVGGAGGGREAFALAEMGYDVVAFEPSRRLANTMAGRIAEGTRVTALDGGYEDLPMMRSLGRDPGTVDITRLGPFDAAVLGWASFSHIRTRQRRVETLRLLSRLAHGPLLVSAFPVTGVSRAKQRAAFGMHIGFYQPMTADDLTAIATDAQCRTLHVDAGQRDGGWLHAVVAAASDRFETE